MFIAERAMAARALWVKTNEARKGNEIGDQRLEERIAAGHLAENSNPQEGFTPLLLETP
jgi:hypothetical protein